MSFCHGLEIEPRVVVGHIFDINDVAMSEPQSQQIPSTIMDDDGSFIAHETVQQLPGSVSAFDGGIVVVGSFKLHHFDPGYPSIGVPKLDTWPNQLVDQDLAGEVVKDGDFYQLVLAPCVLSHLATDYDSLPKIHGLVGRGLV